MISEIFKTYSNFINQGGPVVFILFLISIYLFILIAAKFKFLFFEIDTVKLQFKKDYQNIKNDQFISLNQSILKSDFRSVVVKDFYIIQTLIALCPVLGLLGTVTGMIVTFQMITLYGTGDPKLMAGGISQALVTTVLGLLVAIPTTLLHSFAASSAKGIISVLEEQSTGLLAERAEGS